MQIEFLYSTQSYHWIARPPGSGTQVTHINLPPANTEHKTHRTPNKQGETLPQTSSTLPHASVTTPNQIHSAHITREAVNNLAATPNYDPVKTLTSQYIRNTVENNFRGSVQVPAKLNLENIKSEVPLNFTRGQVEMQKKTAGGRLIHGMNRP